MELGVYCYLLSDEYKKHVKSEINNLHSNLSYPCIWIEYKFNTGTQ